MKLRSHSDGKMMVPASRIAVALGKTKRAVQLALHGTKPSGCVIVKGQQADAWRIDQLPLRFSEELQSIAESLGYRNPEHLLGNPPRRWPPVDKHGDAVAMADVAANQIDRAARLRSALSESLRLKDCLDDRDQRRVALCAFRREYGNASERHWRRLIKRSIQRDAGEERFEDLALYLDEVVMRKPEARTRLAIGTTAGERTVLDCLSRVKTLSKPTLSELALIWIASCEYLADAVAAGAKQKRSQRRLFELLTGSRVELARSDDALKRVIKRKYAQWWTGGQTLAALEDQRPLKSGYHRAPKIGEEDRKKLIGQTRIRCGGRLSQGYRELRDSGELSPELTAAYVSNPTDKSYVPRSIRSAVTQDIRRLENIHLGPRAHRLAGAHHTRDWRDLAAGDWFQSDDLTAPVYFCKTTEHGSVPTRGQFLPMVDERTTYILGFVLIQAKNYNSLSIRALITNVCAEHGLPRRGFYFERGLWKSARLLNGDRTTNFEQIADTGLRRLGMRIRHALLPRAKVIERTLGQLQDLMESMPGYCGRNEVLEKFERFQRVKRDIEAGRGEAAQQLLNSEEIAAAFGAICDRYNETPQDGRKLNGLSPKEGWERLQATEPRARFHAATHYFLASDVRKLRITRNGLTIQVGKQRFNYKGEETGKRQGEYVYAWFNPQRPEFLACTADLAGRGVFSVERSYEVPAVDAPRDLLAAENAKIAAHNGYAQDLYHVVKNTLPKTSFKGQLLDRIGRQLGEEIEGQHKALTARRADEDRLDRDIGRKARRAGISPILVPRSSEALESLDELTAIRAEVDKKIQEQESTV